MIKLIDIVGRAPWPVDNSTQVGIKLAQRFKRGQANNGIAQRYAHAINDVHDRFITIIHAERGRSGVADTAVASQAKIITGKTLLLLKIP
jgi:hypothetical protein